jgi:hypothetical protein
MEDVSYFEFLERWNFQARNPDNWKKWQSPAKPRVLYFFPRYKPLRRHRQFGDFCRVKLLLNHPHREHDELLTVNSQHFDADLLCRRDIDVNYDWSPHVDRYRHPSFSSGEYWEESKYVKPQCGEYATRSS